MVALKLQNMPAGVVDALKFAKVCPLSDFVDHVFALCSLLGFQFAPRIPDPKSRRLYSFGKAAAYPSLEPLIAGSDTGCSGAGGASSGSVSPSVLSASSAPIRLYAAVVVLIGATTNSACCRNCATAYAPATSGWWAAGDIAPSRNASSPARP